MTKHLIPPPGLTRIFAITQMISSVGDGAYYVCVAMYFTQIVGFSPAELGSGLTLAWVIALLAGVPVGHLIDHYGPRRMGVLLAIGASLAIGSYMLVGSLPLFIIAACVYTICQRGMSAAQQAFIAAVVDKSKISETKGFIQSTFNIGLSTGAAIGGVALLIGSRNSYLIVLALDAVSFLVYAWMMLGRLPAVARIESSRSNQRRFTVLRDRPYMLISVINAFLMLHIPLIDVALPLWIARWTAAPHWIVAFLFLLNTVTAALFQVRISRGVIDMASATRFVRLAGVILLFSCLAFASSAGMPSLWATALLVLAAILQVLGEMVQFSGTWTISFGLAPDGKQGEYQSIFGSGLTVAELIGPLVLTSLVVYGGPIGWIRLGVVFLVAGFSMGPAVRWAERARQSMQVVQINTNTQS
ncbi:MFS transporter [Alicyclobacillus vulcanalis]|uniref:Major Facilitator Superfamily protein n=1 Tax=Alicyclobacillus vulcanalis TaxID=252246 RepID=A0A1N7JYU5_9BACL|nr:MFS transporter [Alicyclobacillus vulcanalis]SIS54513.1 Major Facilitator Superfamily protein [Alicyclobacillus vulcanalis]